jgi:hypothetical protein
LITFAFCEKEGNVGVTGLEILGVSTRSGLVSDDDLPKVLIAELDFSLSCLGEIEEADSRDLSCGKLARKCWELTGS